VAEVAAANSSVFAALLDRRKKCACATSNRPRSRHTSAVTQQELFAASVRWPEGFAYAPDFLSAAQEQELLEQIRVLPFQEAHYKQWRARRRIVSFGGRYDFARNELLPAPPIPEFLLPLRAQVAQWAALRPAAIAHAVIAEYPPGTPLGWHRDVPTFEAVAGVSLHGRARLRFRPWPPAAARHAARAISLEPRSAYTIRGVARWGWQHAVSPTKELRYSITFRTRRS
jgi:alkylated DNA repair dioxygenase AlkB